MKKFKKILAIAFLWLLIITIFGIVAVEAQQTITFKPQVPIDNFGEKRLGETGSTEYIAQYVTAIYKYGISIGAILATVVLMAAGLIWLTSGGSQEKIGQAKNYISGSIIGLIILLGSYTLLNTINPELVKFKVQDINTISELTIGCCEYKQYSRENPTWSFPQNAYIGGKGDYFKSEFMSSEECKEVPFGPGVMYGPEYAPMPQKLSGGCVKVGCCGVWIRQFAEYLIVSGSYELKFPSTAANCPNVELGLTGFNDIRLSYSEDTCSVVNAKDCRYLPDGTQCFARSDNTWQGWLINSLCSTDAKCGYCYNGSCLPMLGRDGEICGVEGNLGSCVSSCNISPSINLEEINEGRKCKGNLLCCG